MPQGLRNRWYRARWPDERHLEPAVAEEYFDNHTEAVDYFERRRVEHSLGRVQRPFQSHEKLAAWAIGMGSVMEEVQVPGQAPQTQKLFILRTAVEIEAPGAKNW